MKRTSFYKCTNCKNPCTGGYCAAWEKWFEKHFTAAVNTVKAAAGEQVSGKKCKADKPVRVKMSIAEAAKLIRRAQRL